jgi:hypothetical protein
MFSSSWFKRNLKAASAVMEGFLEATNSHMNEFPKAAAYKKNRKNRPHQRVSETCSCGF